MFLNFLQISLQYSQCKSWKQQRGLWWPVSKFFKINTTRKVFQGLSVRRSSAETVSYTHLDVYKRQERIVSTQTVEINSQVTYL